ncbi:pyridoxamine 5'-phosphate oxidase family protein [Flavobacteriaceae bacterium TP-CH-4]|uniref:Pyridoxamine 5'-phosphate oxidase family protein n=1 Tax=Pelagihabitans pacificus TaxID=2696054 RepID=A0A967EFE7_9FLAO|nr:pyridoxamine 5'-phosphate oxidase family protein [Pelagihabitans pacificus]NHF61338.1 pyridoxamine 5'-phosphate oxidase family protein [Pelagihabitans pacificus]
MTDVFFDELRTDLQQGAVKKGHPFRYCTMATVGLDRIARLRTVVLRKVIDDLHLVFYTDRRSKKIIHIKENPKVSVLFYHPKKLMQVKVEGLAKIIKDEKILQKYWSGVQPSSRKDYTTSLAPGSSIKNPDEVEYLDEDAHFCMLEIVPFKIEYLKLKRPNHLRVRYSKENNHWEGEFMVP